MVFEATVDDTGAAAGTAGEASLDDTAGAASAGEVPLDEVLDEVFAETAATAEMVDKVFAGTGAATGAAVASPEAAGEERIATILTVVWVVCCWLWVLCGPF